LGEDPKILEAYHKMNIAATEEPDDIRESVKLASQILKISAKDMMCLPTAKYFPIPIDHFVTLKNSPTDIFIKIGRGESCQYIKRIHEGEGVEKEVLDRYMRSGVIDLYLESDQRVKFVQAITDELIKVIDDPKSKPEETLSAADQIQQTVAKNIEILGITPQIEKSCNRAMKQMMGESDNYPAIKQLLGQLISNKSGFRFKHSQITTYLCTAILREIDWRKAALTEKDKDVINRHAQISAELIHNYPRSPMGVSTIIRQHHGVMNGLGFSSSFSGSLSPLTIIFMVAEKAAHVVLESEFEEMNRMKIMYELEQVFKTKRFEKMIEAISKVMK
jgi:hypothetical protein